MRPARAALAAALAASAARAATMDLTLIDNNEHQSAKCNDGTPAGYYLKKSGSGSDVIVVHLEGGGWCYDAASCAARPSSLTSSKGWAQQRDVGGLFNATDPTLRDATLVYVPYCSSDAWIGHASAGSVAGSPYGFHGQAIVRAVLEEVAKVTGLGAGAPAQYLISGCSAGARGVLFNAEAIAAQLRGMPAVTHFGLLLDSAFWVDITPPNASVTSFQDQARGVVANFNVTGGLSPACVAAFPGADAWKCVYGQYAVPFIDASIPYLLHAFQYDEFQISGDLGIPFSGVPKSAGQLSFAEAFRKLTAAAAGADVITPARNGTAALLPACYHHCATETSLFTDLATDGVSLQDAVVAWFTGSGGAPAFTVDTCSGFNCGAQCPAP